MEVGFFETKQAFRYHTKLITTLDFEPKSGSRLLSGSFDCSLAVWDFGTCKATIDPADASGTSINEPWRVIEPMPGQTVSCARFSPDGKYFVVTCASAHLLLFSRDAILQTEFARGDPYIRDLRTTCGHISVVNGITWTSDVTFFTWSTDGTVRWWNIEQKSSTACLFVRGVPASVRVSITSAAVIPSGRIALACSDRALRIYTEKGPWTNAPLGAWKLPDDEENDIHFLLPVASKGLLFGRTKAAIYQWDVTNPRSISLKKRISCPGNAHANLLIAEETLLVPTLVGISLYSTDLEFIANLESAGAHTVLAWHPKLRQAIAGATTGQLQCHYNSKLSTKGVLLALRTPAKLPEDNLINVKTSEIITPFALDEADDAVKDLDTLRRQQYMQRKEDKRKPDLPMRGYGFGGRIGSSVTQNILKEFLPEECSREQDPREALLSYAELAAKDPKYVTNAYKSTQPKPIYDIDAVKEMQEEADLLEQKKRTLEDVDEAQVRAAIRRKLKHQ